MSPSNSCRENTTRRWQSGRTALAELEFLDIIDRNRPREGWHFEEVVIFAGGTFLDRSTQGDAMFQFVCAKDTVAELEKRGHTGVFHTEVFAQDPCYWPVDVKLLRSKDVAVLSPEYMAESTSMQGMAAAKDHMGRYTLLFEFGVHMPKRMCEDLCEAETGLRVGTSTTFMRTHIPADHVDLFDERHESCAFPPFVGHERAFFSLQVYWWR